MATIVDIEHLPSSLSRLHIGDSKTFTVSSCLEFVKLTFEFENSSSPSWFARPLEDIVQTRRGNHLESALLISSLLIGAGFECFLLSGSFTGRCIKDNPSLVHSDKADVALFPLPERLLLESIFETKKVDKAADVPVAENPVVSTNLLIWIRRCERTANTDMIIDPLGASVWEISDTLFVNKLFFIWNEANIWLYQNQRFVKQNSAELFDLHDSSSFEPHLNPNEGNVIRHSVNDEQHKRHSYLFFSDVKYQKILRIPDGSKLSEICQVFSQADGLIARESNINEFGIESVSQESYKGRSDKLSAVNITNLDAAFTQSFDEGRSDSLRSLSVKGSSSKYEYWESRLDSLMRSEFEHGKLYVEYFSKRFDSVRSQSVDFAENFYSIEYCDSRPISRLPEVREIRFFSETIIITFQVDGFTLYDRNLKLARVDGYLVPHGSLDRISSDQSSEILLIERQLKASIEESICRLSAEDADRLRYDLSCTKNFHAPDESLKTLNVSPHKCYPKNLNRKLNTFAKNEVASDGMLIDSERISARIAVLMERCREEEDAIRKLRAEMRTVGSTDSIPLTEAIEKLNILQSIISRMRARISY